MSRASAAPIVAIKSAKPATAQTTKTKVSLYSDFTANSERRAVQRPGPGQDMLVCRDVLALEDVEHVEQDDNYERDT